MVIKYLLNQKTPHCWNPFVKKEKKRRSHYCHLPKEENRISCYCYVSSCDEQLTMVNHS